jgi:hypothetical protein
LAAFFIHGFSPCLSPLIQQRRHHRVRRRPRRCRSRRRPPCWQRSGRRTQWSPDPANAAETRPGRSGRTSPPSCRRGSRTARSRPHAVGRRPRRSPPSHAPPLLRSLCGRTVTSVPAVDLGRTLRGRGETRRAWRRGAPRRRPIHGPRRSGADLGAGCKIWGGCAPRADSAVGTDRQTAREGRATREEPEQVVHHGRRGMRFSGRCHHPRKYRIPDKSCKMPDVLPGTAILNRNPVNLPGRTFYRPRLWIALIPVFGTLHYTDP